MVNNFFFLLELSRIKGSYIWEDGLVVVEVVFISLVVVVVRVYLFVVFIFVFCWLDKEKGILIDFGL